MNPKAPNGEPNPNPNPNPNGYADGPSGSVELENVLIVSGVTIPILGQVNKTLLQTHGEEGSESRVQDSELAQGSSSLHGDKTDSSSRGLGGSRDSSMTVVTGHYLPALDGLRAFAVGAVVAYHLSFGWASGGYLGVDLFFVLSGFLITSLLVEEWLKRSTISFPKFWARRARRLLPALFMVLVAIAIFVVLNGQFGGPGAGAQIDLSGLRGDALATLFYVANWHAIFAHQSYFAQFSAPSPLGQTWSLAIEEQFYLVWPIVLFFLLTKFVKHWRTVGIIFTGVVALASAGLMAILYHPGGDPTRVYFGTDTRLFDLLIGACVALIVVSRPQPGPRMRWILHISAPIAAVVLGVFWVRAGTAGGLPVEWMFRGGFLVCSFLAAIIVADVRQLHIGPLGWILSVRPIRWIGKISYGIYLWHWPIIVYLTTQRTGLSGAWIDVARIGATLLVSTLSFYLVEQPIRRMRMQGWKRFALAPACAVLTAIIVLVATLPAVSAPSIPAPTTKAVSVGGKISVPGSGNYSNEVPIKLPPGSTISPTNPLRIMLIGDSVLEGAAPGIKAAFATTGEVTVINRTFPGWGLGTDPTWRTGIPSIIAAAHPQIIVASWSWDNNGPTTPNALYQPIAYTKELEQFMKVVLTPGDGVDGFIFTQFPPSGPLLAIDKQTAQLEDIQRAQGDAAWARIASSMPSKFPGKVMYLPIATSVLLNGKFTYWLPPPNDPSAPTKDWVRVRRVDGVHFCPAGVVRYGDALLADMTAIFHLKPSNSSWTNAPWVNSPNFNNPPGECPDDHPPTTLRVTASTSVGKQKSAK